MHVSVRNGGIDVHIGVLSTPCPETDQLSSIFASVDRHHHGRATVHGIGSKYASRDAEIRMTRPVHSRPL
jgi:hypothetical protein